MSDMAWFKMVMLVLSIMAVGYSFGGLLLAYIRQLRRERELLRRRTELDRQWDEYLAREVERAPDPAG